MATITIGGVSVDTDDPCALYQALLGARLKMLAGESISEVSASDRSVRYNAWFSSLAALEAEINRQKDLCEQSTGGRPSRYAIRAGFRRWP